MRQVMGWAVLAAVVGCAPDEPADLKLKGSTTTTSVATQTTTQTTTTSTTATTTTPMVASAYVAVSAGKRLTCTVDDVGAASCASSTTFAMPPAPAGPFVDIAAGWASACAVGQDGSLECWGCGWINGPCTDTPNGNNWVSVEAAEDYFCAQNSAGNVRCWGQEYWPGPANNQVYTDYAVGITGFIGLKANGGNDRDGETADINQPLSIVGAGRSIACGVGLNDGLTYCWYVDADDLPTTGVVALDSFDADMCWLDDQGHVGCVQNMPNAATDGFDPATQVFTRISAGDKHACGLTDDGRALCWPQNGRAETSIAALPTP